MQSEEIGAVALDDLLYDVARPSFRFGVDLAQILAHDAQAEDLNAAEKIDRQQGRSPAGNGNVGEEPNPKDEDAHAGRK